MIFQINMVSEKILNGITCTFALLNSLVVYEWHLLQTLIWIELCMDFVTAESFHNLIFIGKGIRFRACIAII